MIKWTKSAGGPSRFDPYTLTSACGRFTIEREMVAASRNGCWRTSWRFTEMATGRKEDFDTLRDAKQCAQDYAED